MISTCFHHYFDPIIKYVTSTWHLTVESNFIVVLTSSFMISSVKIAESIYDVEIFGINNFLLVLVIATVLVDAYYGVRRSVIVSKSALLSAYKEEEGSAERRKFCRIYNKKKFDIKKLQYTFFKCFTLMGYLFFVKTLLNLESPDDVGQFLGYTSELILKAPLAIFWYYEFKSIGDNSAFLFGKKAPIFKIVESIFEFRINKLFKKDE